MAMLKSVYCITYMILTGYLFNCSLTKHLIEVNQGLIVKHQIAANLNFSEGPVEDTQEGYSVTLRPVYQIKLQ